MSVISFTYFLKPNEVVAQCPISAGGDSAVFHGSLSDSSVPSSSASNGQQFTVIAALPSTGMYMYAARF